MFRTEYACWGVCRFCNQAFNSSSSWLVLSYNWTQDIDAMPIHPLENMPEVMRRRRVVVDGIDRSLVEDQKVDLKPKSWSDLGVGGAARAALNEQLERPLTVLSQRFLNDLSKRAQVVIADLVIVVNFYSWYNRHISEDRMISR